MNDSKRGRKRALSTTGLLKTLKFNCQKGVGPKQKPTKGKGELVVVCYEVK